VPLTFSLGYPKAGGCHKGDRVVVIMNGKFFAPTKVVRERCWCYCYLLPTLVCDRTTSFLWRDTLLLTVTVIILDPIKLVNTFSIWHEF
jgi:hypothetical protein